MKTIELTRGLSTKVDNEDYKKFCKYRWYASSPSGGVRAVRNGKNKKGKRTTVYLSREIMDSPSGKYIDHINRQPLDNRRKNLRICNHKENGRNSDIYSNNKSGYKGVCWKNTQQKWVSRISVEGKSIFLGYFSDKNEAAKVYNESAKKHHKEFAFLNNINLDPKGV